MERSSQGSPKVALYTHVQEVASGSKLLGQCLVNKYKYRNHLSRLYMPKEDPNK